MNKLVLVVMLIITLPLLTRAQKKPNEMDYEIIKISSRINPLKLGILHKSSATKTSTTPILFIHGASFPSALASAFKMDGKSWMDYVAKEGHDVFALDFLGYGYSDRYDEMMNDDPRGLPLGRASEIEEDLSIAVDFICKKYGFKDVHLIAHSWGGTVATLYSIHHSEKVKTLTLFATITPRNPPEKKEQHANVMFETLTPEERIAAMKDLTPTGENCMLETEIYGKWKDAWLSSDPLTFLKDRRGVTYPSGWMADYIDLINGDSFLPIGELTVPLLFIRGEWDDYPSAEDAATFFASITKSTCKKLVTIGRGTHVLHLEQNRTQLYREVERFIGDVEGADTSGLIAVIFEVIPNEQYKSEYLKIAAELKEELTNIKGFISIERFQSLGEPNKILSLSLWRNEQAIEQWRNLEGHRLAQSKGRDIIFKDYRLRVARVIRDYGMFDRGQVPADSQGFHH